MERGTVVIAEAGKEKGGLYVVTEVIGDRLVLIADGRRRPLEKPKRKNVLHLRRTNTVIGEISTNRQLRIFLNQFSAEQDPARTADSGEHS